jgi:hypothetical protein
MTVLLPVGDLIWKAKQAGALGMLVQSLAEIKPALPLIALLGIGMAVVLVINWLLVKGVNLLLSKLIAITNENCVGTLVWFCLTLLPLALRFLK